MRLARRAAPTAATALDVGAAAGLLVKSAVESGFDAVGVEPSQALAEVARREHGGDVRTGVLPHPDLRGRFFEIVFLVDVLEHVADPLDLLTARRELRSTGGQ